MLKISTSHLDSFIMYDKVKTDFHGNELIDQEKLISYIKREAPVSYKRDYGIAFHAVMENPERYFNFQYQGFLCNNIMFPRDVITECLKYTHPFFSKEVKGIKEYELFTGEKIQVVGKADQLVANTVVEFKTNWGSMPESLFDKYSNSPQWKIYCDIFEADTALYNIFKFKDPIEGDIELLEIEQFHYSRYADMKQDIVEVLTNYVEFIHANNLESYVTKSEYKNAIS